MNHHPLHLDANYAGQATDFGRNVVVATTSTRCCSHVGAGRLGQGHREPGGRVAAARGADLPRRHHLRRDDRARQTAHVAGDRGIVQVETRGYNQHGAVVWCSAASHGADDTYLKERGGEQPAARARPADQLIFKEPSMGRLAQTEGLTEFEQDILATVRDFVNREIIPVATELEHRDEYPARSWRG